MEATFISASRRKGRGKKDDSPYDIAELHYGVPEKSGTKNDDDGKVRWAYEAYGVQVYTMELHPDHISDFAKCKVGQQVNLILEPLPNNPKNNQVVGIREG